jgi:secernin
LERAHTAQTAVSIIGDLVETYGQGGTCYHTSSNLTTGYDNSFLIVDRNEAWTMETCDRVWVAKQVTGIAVDR